MGHTVVLFDNDGVEGFILEGDRLALAAVEDDGLCGRLFHLETGGRSHLRDGVLAGVEPLALLMELDFAVGIGEDSLWTLRRRIHIYCGCVAFGGDSGKAGIYSPLGAYG